MAVRTTSERWGPPSRASSPASSIARSQWAASVFAMSPSFAIVIRHCASGVAARIWGN
jgi:hypothetical protein